MRRHIIIGLALLMFAACSGGDSMAKEWNLAFDAQQVGWFLNVWGSSEDNLYAAGGTPDNGVLMRWDGTAWTEVLLDTEVPLLTWAFGFGANDITVVGNEGTIVHFDGAVWTLQETPTEQDLWGVWGAAPDDLWAVGGRGRAAGEATLLHYDGSRWSEVEVPPLERANVWAFFKVWGTSASNVYVVGQRGAVLHYDGVGWREELVGASDDLVSLWGTGPDNIVAVGGRGAGIVSRWNGSEWRTESLSPLPGLNGVWMGADGVAYAVGTVGTLIALEPGTFEYEQSFAATTLDFHGIFSAGERLVAVGGNLFAVEPPFQGIAFERPLN